MTTVGITCRACPVAAIATICWVFALSGRAEAGQQASTVGVGDWLTFSSNLDGGYRKTQFFEPDHNTGLFQWDSRIDLWLPPFRKTFAWGPYIRVAGIASSRSEAWENAWLSRPGFGVQAYPLSARRPRPQGSLLAQLLGPVRVFAEYNALNYWGNENEWRPDGQTRVGLDYWRAVHVNDPTRFWWAEVWNGLYWQSSNEFADSYRTVILADAVRVGLRKPRNGIVSTLTPYVAVESSRTKNNQYYWENRLLIGGGLRVSPALARTSGKEWLSRLVVYGEVLDVAAYYGVSAPLSIPKTDTHIGVSINIGDWYK